MRAKFHVALIDNRMKYIYFAPVYTGSEENKRFFRKVPGGMIALYGASDEVCAEFTAGQEVYVDFTPVDPAKGATK